MSKNKMRYRINVISKLQRVIDFKRKSRKLYFLIVGKFEKNS